ncbi:ribosome maturation factor RimP [Merismopedia glauca]|uniref:Ribosome maturation factor RimP n=1 Tax=Merismopedia glauca CCAP 1448/3 TaxID=1296344 RepID=A0A2T1C1M1_9CYAN|nr:ribosome maturation factor RimP [Merismopedia glauca]PSB02169.1 ribosome maturation factor RimP [Merismopedia glauca CCAP 1448/3]
MTHPIIPEIVDLANAISADLGLEVVGAVFHTHQSPPILRVNVRNRNDETSLDDCERMSKALEAKLDAEQMIEGRYVLEVSSPGISTTLTSDREFISFRGFPIKITTTEPFLGKSQWKGLLVKRDENNVYINQKGKTVTITRSAIEIVELDEDSST